MFNYVKALLVNSRFYVHVVILPETRNSVLADVSFRNPQGPLLKLVIWLGLGNFVTSPLVS